MAEKYYSTEKIKWLFQVARGYEAMVEWYEEHKKVQNSQFPTIHNFRYTMRQMEAHPDFFEEHQRNKLSTILKDLENVRAFHCAKKRNAELDKEVKERVSDSVL